MIDLHTIILNSYSIPLVRDVGYIHDQKGIYGHPVRKMEKIHVFVFVIEGSIHVYEDGTEYRINAGSYLFLRKNISHWGGELYKPGTKWYYIHFYDSPQNEITEEVEYMYFPHSSMIYEDTYSTKMSLPKHGTVYNADFMKTKLKNLVSLYENPHPLRPLQLSLLTYQFFIELYSSHLEERKETKKHYIVNQMVKLLRTTENKKLTGEEIANTLGMNYAYLSTLFKKQTGRSVSMYQNELLIEKAIDMFKKNDGNVSEVSDALGFSNPFYFSRVFKKITGVSPTTYINENYRYQ